MNRQGILVGLVGICLVSGCANVSSRPKISYEQTSPSRPEITAHAPATLPPAPTGPNLIQGSYGKASANYYRSHLLIETPVVVVDLPGNWRPRASKQDRQGLVFLVSTENPATGTIVTIIEFTDKVAPQRAAELAAKGSPGSATMLPERKISSNQAYGVRVIQGGRISETYFFRGTDKRTTAMQVNVPETPQAFAQIDDIVSSAVKS